MITEEKALISCQKCGKPIGIFTNEEIAEEIRKLRCKPYKFLCEDCKSNFKKWITYKNRTKHDTREIVLICDIVKDLHELNPTHDELVAIRKVSRDINCGVPTPEIIDKYDRELEKIKVAKGDKYDNF